MWTPVLLALPASLLTHSRQTREITCTAVVQDLNRQVVTGHRSPVSTHVFLLGFWQVFLRNRILSWMCSLLFIPVCCVSHVMMRNLLWFFALRPCHTPLWKMSLRSFPVNVFRTAWCVWVWFLSFVYFPYLIFSNINNSVFIEFENVSAIAYWEMLERWTGVCLFVCTSVSRFAYPLTPVLRSEVRGGRLPLLSSTLVLRQGLPVNLKLAALTASKLQEASCSASSAQGFQACQIFLRVWGSELRSSCLHSKYFSYWAIPPILYFHFSVISFSFFGGI